ncbi:MAG: TatD family hydrolase [Eubacteriales bacterium]|nr:TatD family hydrolase [Eubacteriales bacterium]
MQLFDSHCHLEDAKFDVDRQQVIQNMQEAGVKYCTCAGSDIASSEAIQNLSREYPFVFSACGVHPHEAETVEEGYLERLEKLAAFERCVAIGEIGLDFYYDNSPRDIQKKVFEEQMELAYRLNKPTILHVRDAHGAAIEMLTDRKQRLSGGILHCYSGSKESAKTYLDLGFYISFAGSLTFKNAKNLQAAAKYIPSDRLLIETDSPYLTPVPKRGQRNEPANVRHVCEFLAEIRETTVQFVAESTFENACRVYGIAY